MKDPYGRGGAAPYPPMLRVSSVLLGILAINAAVFAIVNLAPDGVGAWILRHLGFISARPEGLAFDFSAVSYGFVHQDFLHLAVNAGFLTAFGAPAVACLGPRRFLWFYLACTAAGALAWRFYEPSSLSPLIGASAGVSGLAAAAARLIFAPGGALRRLGSFSPGSGFGSGFVGASSASRPARPLALRELFRHAQARAFIGVWLGLNIGMAIFARLFEGATIAWAAHLGGFAFGLLCLGVFVPPRRAAGVEIGRD